ncbi:hypothetical protein [Gardnerella vaginalis]|uniref:Uncharacterized protein n=2 Tax=Gardnerella TaxID=2701 RepID=A0A2K1SUQ1_GARVA|nr:hypothetical protein [Gardnerella vaginalis]PNS43261.1 hypothetical protein BFS05_04270 [Gardnerella vaginalis]
MRSKALLASNILASIYIPILFGTTILLIEQISKIRVNIPYMSFEFWILIFKLVQYSSTALTTVFVIVVLALLHVVLFVLAILLGWIAYARKSWGTGLASAIIYLVGSVIFPISLVLVLPIMSIVFGFIGAFDQRKYHKKEKLENNTVEVNLRSHDDHVICQVSQTKVLLPANNSDNFHKDGMNADANNNIDVNHAPTFAGQAPTLVGQDNTLVGQANTLVGQTPALIGQNPNAYENQHMPVTPAQVTSMSAAPQNVINTTSVTDSTSSINTQNEGTNHKNNSFRDYYISLKQSTTKVFQNNVIITKCRTFFKKEYKAIEDTISNIDNNGGSAKNNTKNNVKNNVGNSVRNSARNNAMNSAVNNTRNGARNVNNHVMNVNNGARNINNNATNVNSSGINANNVINVQSNANTNAPYRR